MSSLFVDSMELVRAPGAYAVEVAPPVVIDGQVVGYLGIVFQGEWGPVNEVGTPSSSAEFLATYFPPGSPHTSAGYYALMRRKRLPLRPVRILKNGVKAAKTATAGTGTYTVTAKYPGTLGNSITVTWKAATDGDAAHRDVEIVLTDPVTGTSRERIRNVVYTTNPDVSASRLIESFTFAAASALPAVDATVTLGVGGTSVAGSNGDPITSTEYEAAFDLLALRAEVTVVTLDDCGAAIRSAVNDALVEHAANNRNRIVVFQAEDQGTAWADVVTTVDTHSPSIRGDRVLPQGAWVKTLDDSGTARTTPFATYVASALVNLEPQQSHAWWDDRATQFYGTIAGIEDAINTADEGVQGDATEKGIGLPIRLESGAYASLHDRTSSLTSGKKFTVTRRIKDFLARSILRAVTSFINGPNWTGRHLDIKGIVDVFLKNQGPKVRREEPRVVAYSTSIANNTSEGIAAGGFNLGLDAQTPAVLEKFGLLLNVGESVTVRETT